MVERIDLFKQIDDSIHIFCQKEIIEMNFNWLRCSTNKNVLYCSGKLRPNDLCREYEVEIFYKANVPPNVYINHPRIKYHDDIHLYNDKSLCLYYPLDMPWGKHILLANTIIPWISEWIVLYELWKITGKWEGPEVKHNSI